MDRNQAIGLVLITVIMMGYFMFFGNEQKNIVTQTTDTTTTIYENQKELQKADTLAADTAVLNKKFGGFSGLATGDARQDTLANKDVRIVFDSKGGSIQSVLLKDYETYNNKPLYLVQKQSNDIDLLVSTTSGEINLADLYYRPVKTDSSLIYRAELGPGQYIEQVYKLSEEGYVLNYDLNFVGLDNLIKNEPVKFNWNMHLQKLEPDVKQSREQSTINYYLASEEFESLGEETEKLVSPIKWVSMKQKFFSTAIIADNAFSNAVLQSNLEEADTTTVKELQANLSIPIGDLKTGKGNFRFYFGPNHFQTLNKVTDGFHKNVDLGWPLINWINRFIVIPVFNLLEGFISNYGIIIIILVILIKLLLFPLSYKSYVSMAKMKVLKPEIDEIKERHEGDMQKSQMETMELYKKVGINPLSGCIPVLLQMPILLAMFSFFPHAIELRQESFLWADDLSTYDALFTWDAYIPLLSDFYGNHFSLFTFLMTISTIVYTWFNNQVSTVTGPMKTVSYVMPVVFMFVLNSFPAGLSFYYFVSNIVTIGQQLIIRKFVDEDKIKKTLEENKKRSATNPGKKSRWMSRLEEAMKAKEEEAKKRKKK